MNTRRSHLGCALGLCAAVLLWGSIANGWGQDKTTTSKTPEAGQSVPDQISIPQGEPLPDMPDPSEHPLSQAFQDQSAIGQSLSPNYIIGPEDVLSIEVFNVPELKKTARVSNDGMIDLALIGPVKAAGLTTEELRKVLEIKYGESYLQNPEISVFVTDFKARSVSVIGAVERPGLYQLTAPRTLIEVLSMAGGLAKRSSAPAGRTLVVTRKDGFGGLPIMDGMELLAPDKLQIEVRKLLYSQESGLNIQVRPLDTISVATADLVYVVGDVKKPTGILMEDRDDITVLQAIAMAEGLNSTAKRNKARIFRRVEDGSKIEIPIKLGAILKGKAPDVALVANDVLFVPDSTGKVILHRGLEATISTISGVIIWGSAR